MKILEKLLLMIPLHINIISNKHLGLDIGSYLESFMSLEWTNSYIYMVIDDKKFHMRVIIHYIFLKHIL